MIFISYNHKDERLVDMIARRLEGEFGRDNIFYDKWSIYPGDSIIGKMNEGLQSFTTFFYFLSSNSLSSEMVSKEWQSALYKAINENLKFVAIRLDDCKPPAILTDALYIDLYGKGLDDALQQMKCVVNKKNPYKAFEDLDNIIGVIQSMSKYEINIEIKATMFSENEANFGFVCNNAINEFEAITQEGLYFGSSGNTFQCLDGRIIDLKIHTVKLIRPITPKNPLKVTIKSKGDKDLKFIGVMKILSDNEGKWIKIVSNQEI